MTATDWWPWAGLSLLVAVMLMSWVRAERRAVKAWAAGYEAGRRDAIKRLVRDARGHIMTPVDDTKGRE